MQKQMELFVKNFKKMRNKGIIIYAICFNVWNVYAENVSNYVNKKDVENVKKIFFFQAPKQKELKIENDGNKKNKDGKDLDEIKKEDKNKDEKIVEIIDEMVLKNRKANTKDRMSISLGVSNVRMEIKLTDKAHCIIIALCIRDNKNLYQLLEKFKDDIEKDVMYPLIWKNIDSLKQSEVILEIPGLNFDDDSNYDDLMHDTLENIVRLKDIYIKYLKKIGNM